MNRGAMERKEGIMDKNLSKHKHVISVGVVINVDGDDAGMGTGICNKK